MSDSHYDLCVIGGGVHGAGVARDAAGRGLSVILVEAGDLACMTSSASSKMLHGGLRYLENFEFGLVREALQERETIMRIAPHISKPMDFVMPHVPELRPAWMIKVGLFLYDRLAGARILKKSRAFKMRLDAYSKPIKDTYTQGFIYTDGQVDDARLAVLNAMDAQAHGADIRTYTLCEALQSADKGWRVTLRDRHNIEAEQFVTASHIVNTAGPLIDRVLECSGVSMQNSEAQEVEHSDDEAVGGHTAPALRLVKGSHIVVPRLYEGEHGYLLQNDDGRVVFLWPYEGDYTLIGTTDIEFSGAPGDVDISDEEIDYLCAAVTKFTKRTVQPSSIIAHYSGVRTLVDHTGVKAFKVSRAHTIHEYEADSGGRMLSLYGGKLTTYRSTAQELVDKIAGGSSQWTAEKPLPGGAFKQVSFDLFLQEKLYQYSTLERSCVRRLARLYGTKMDVILNNAKRMDDLGKHYGADLYENEVRYLIAHEFARTPRDILWRRTKLDLRIDEAGRKALGEDMAALVQDISG